jgi:putative flippase GtrA
MPLDGRTPRSEGGRSKRAPTFRVVANQLRRLIPFLVTGFANSVVGYSTIFFCLFIGIGGIAANTIGYAVALTCSFVLNRNYVFGVKGGVSHTEIVRFLCVFLVAYGVNIGVLLLVQPMFGEASVIAQVLAIATYTLVFYPLSGVFVFRRGVLGAIRART